METEWIEWEGGKCPIDAGAIAEARLRNGYVQTLDPAGDYDWCHADDAYDGYDIIAYRVISA